MSKVVVTLVGVSVALALTGCRDEAQVERSVQPITPPVFSAEQVRRAFVAHGIQLVRSPGSSVGTPVAYDSPNAGPDFLVRIYRNVDAMPGVELSVTVDPASSIWDAQPRITVLEQRNVRVIYDRKRAVIHRKIVATLDSLIQS